MILQQIQFPLVQF